MWGKTMIPTNQTKLEIEFIKIAKKHEISMPFSSEKRIEVNEQNRGKVKIFVREIKKISPKTKIVDLIVKNQHIDVKGNNILNSKSLYLVEDDYYRKLIGEDFTANEDHINDFKIMKESQISMFG